MLQKTLSKLQLAARSPYASLGILLSAAGLGIVTLARAAEPQRERTDLTQPVYRVAAKVEPVNTHPLDAALNVARDGLHHIRSQVQDYTCTLVKRERVKGDLTDYEYMFTKIRNRKVADGKVVVPFSVYMYFLKPQNVRGREVVYVEGRNNNKMMAHEGGATGKLLPSVWLNPDGPLAMRGNLYPITEVGVENLVLQLISRGERDRARDECEVKFFNGAKINGRTCTLLEVRHPVPRPYFDFHIARVFIDDELNVPIRYAAYTWPQQEGAEPPVIEEYTYLDLKLNVGLTDADFDPDNSSYNF